MGDERRTESGQCWEPGKVRVTRGGEGAAMRGPQGGSWIVPVEEDEQLEVGGYGCGRRPVARVKKHAAVPYSH